MVINFGVFGVSLFVTYLLSIFGYHFHTGPQITSTAVLTVIQCILVYNWSKEYNLNLQEKIL